jgi:CRISPR-associated protein Csb2
LRDAGLLIKTVRDDCANRLEASLKSQFPDKARAVKRVFGLCRDATEADKASRIRIIPLPSIGHPQADRGIRRIFVEIPPNCPIRVQDIDWAFVGFCKFDASTGEVDWMLTTGEDRTMLDHYGIGSDEKIGFRTWHTVTPTALPIERSHGRNSGAQRATIEAHVSSAVAQALRHVAVIQEPVSIRVQPEPFDAKGARAEAFAEGTRFAKERLWHIEIVFAVPIAGPLLLGDGRYLGLGLMAPVQRVEGIHCYTILEGLADGADPTVLAQALRRAVMSRVQDAIGKRASLPGFFSGHEPDGAPSRSGTHAHLAFATDLVRHRLLIVAPYVLEGRQPTRSEQQLLKMLDAAVADLSDLRAGLAGRLKLAWSPIHAQEDPLFGAARSWESVTEYQPTRHGKRMTPIEALVSDVQSEVLRRGLAIPTHIEVIELHEGPRGGVTGRVRLHFATAVSGPILIGRTRHFGGGLFSVIE